MPGRGAGRGRGAGGRGRTKPPKYTEEIRQRALEMLKTMSFKEVGEALGGISKSTLHGWKKNPNAVLGRGHTTALTMKEEALIVHAFKFLSDGGIPMNRLQLLAIVQQFSATVGRATPFNEGVPGRRWLESFGVRHHQTLRLRYAEYIHYKRAEGMSESNIRNYFNLLGEIYAKNPEWHTRPHLVFNLDETCLQCDKTGEKVYTNAFRKNAYKIVSGATKKAFTLLVCCNAGGIILPPFHLYKAASLDLAWTEDGVVGAGYGVSDSGWMTDINFEGWIEGVFVPYVKTNCDGHQVLLTYDGHNSHITYRTIEIAMLNKITILCLPPNTSHATQPLDVGVFKSLKSIWRSVLIQHYADPMNVVEKTNFPSLVAQIWEKLKTSNARAGFEATGLHPLNTKALDDKIIPPPADMGPGAGNAMDDDDGVKHMINAICDIFAKSHPPHPDNAQPGPSGLDVPPSKQQPRKRARVQAKCGEVLTYEQAASRVRAEEMEKKKKADELAERKRVAAEKREVKAAIVAANKIKQAAKKQVTIQRRALPKGSNSQKGAVLNRASTLDGFVGLRQNPLPGSSSASESFSSPLLSEADESIPNLAPARRGKVQPTRKSSQKDSGYYQEDPSMDTSMDTSDPDDPSPDPVFTMSELFINDFVIFDLNGQCFPGKILSVNKRKRRFTIATMRRFKHEVPDSWYMPDSPDKHPINLNLIKKKINKPTGKRWWDKEVFIKEMSDYGW